MNYNLSFNDKNNEIKVEFDENKYDEKDIKKEVSLLLTHIEDDLKTFLKEYEGLKTFDDMFDFANKYQNFLSIQEPIMFAKFTSLKNNKNTSWMIYN